MRLSIFALLVTLVALPQGAYSQCIDSSTLGASNYYLLKGAEAREQLALCREYRKIDSAVIAEQDKIQSKLLDELQARDKKVTRFKNLCTILAAVTIVALLL
jgi:hypothetical protein